MTICYAHSSEVTELMVAKGLDFNQALRMLFDESVAFEQFLTANSISYNHDTDDGDALRLAVKLGKTINIRLSAKIPNVSVDGGPVILLADYNNDPYAATRRAIVRTAAEIGKEMK